MVFESNQATKPAYNEPWFWFILTPIFIVIVACSITVTIAFTKKDDAVVDNYYQEGKMISRHFSADTRAAELDLRADVQFDLVSQEILIDLYSNSPLPERLELSLSHPFRESEDAQAILENVSPGRYRADIGFPLKGRRYLRLMPHAADADNSFEAWRLSGHIQFNETAHIQLTP